MWLPFFLSPEHFSAAREEVSVYVINASLLAKEYSEDKCTECGADQCRCPGPQQLKSRLFRCEYFSSSASSLILGSVRHRNGSESNEREAKPVAKTGSRMPMRSARWVQIDIDLLLALNLDLDASIGLQAIDQSRGCFAPTAGHDWLVCALS